MGQWQENRVQRNVVPFPKLAVVSSVGSGFVWGIFV